VHVNMVGDGLNPLNAFGLGFFPSGCPEYPAVQAFSIFSPADMDFTVPEDGIFIIGVTACCDLNFSGSGTLEGGYVVSVVPDIPVELIDSISGQVTDKVTGRPLAGPVEPFALVQLYRAGPDGFEFLAQIPTGEDGNYLFSAATVGNRLLPGDYMVMGFANQYQTSDNVVDIINVQAHEARVAPVLALLSNPVRFTNVKPCDNNSAREGKCDFSFIATLGTADITKGALWSLSHTSGTGGIINATEFLVCEQPLILIPGRRTEVRCGFTVPANVPDGALFCADARFGEGIRTNPYFTVQELIVPLFCMTKLPRQGSFQVLPQPEAVEHIRHRSNQR
jgi:hypothetical protein